MASGEAGSGAVRSVGATATGAGTAAPTDATPTGAAQPPVAGAGGTVTRPGGPAGPQGRGDGQLGPREGTPGHGVAGGGSPDSAIVDRTSAVVGRTPGPFSPRQLARLDEALTMSSRETGLDFSVYVGALDEPTREHAERLHAGLGAKATNGVLVAVSPGQRVLHVVTGELSSRRLPDRSCALAALSMRAALSLGDLVGGIVNGLRMLSDQSGHPHRGR